jgi:DNA-binding transcriptional ArsR family regulator
MGVVRHIWRMRPFVHPPADALKLESVLYALADPVRLEIVRRLVAGTCGLNCSAAAPQHLPKSTQSHHFQILREAGLIRSERRGTEVVNTLRVEEIESRFPGVVCAILKAAKPLECPDKDATASK